MVNVSLRATLRFPQVASAVESRRCRVLLNPKYQALLSPRHHSNEESAFSLRFSGIFTPRRMPLLTPLWRNDRSKALNAAIFEFLKSLPDDAKKAGPFQPVLRLLLRMGLRTRVARQLVGDDTLAGPYLRRLQKVLDGPLPATDAGDAPRAHPRVMSESDWWFTRG